MEKFVFMFNGYCTNLKVNAQTCLGHYNITLYSNLELTKTLGLIFKAAKNTGHKGQHRHRVRGLHGEHCQGPQRNFRESFSIAR